MAIHRPASKSHNILLRRAKKTIVRGLITTAAPPAESRSPPSLRTNTLNLRVVIHPIHGPTNKIHTVLHQGPTEITTGTHSMTTAEVVHNKWRSANLLHASGQQLHADTAEDAR